MNGHGHEFGHEFRSESMTEVDSDTDMRFFGTSHTDMDKVMTSDTGSSSDTVMSEYEGRGHGHGQTSDMLVRSSPVHHTPNGRFSLLGCLSNSKIFQNQFLCLLSLPRILCDVVRMCSTDVPSAVYMHVEQPNHLYRMNMRLQMEMHLEL